MNNSILEVSIDANQSELMRKRGLDPFPFITHRHCLTGSTMPLGVVFTLDQACELFGRFSYVQLIYCIKEFPHLSIEAVDSYERAEQFYSRDPAEGDPK